jgi:mono/diheme cytochrome c family protein
MKLRMLVLGLSLALLTGCSLAGDITPPPALATQQAAQVSVQSTPLSSQPEQASDEQASAPTPPDANPSLMSGALIYVERCAPCHGEDGLGRGSMAANLEIPPSPLGDPAFAVQVRPEDWYAIVTQGRMERFMPPFASLSDAQRWDVVAYALSLSTPGEVVAEGEELYSQVCIECHGPTGAEGTAEIDLTAPAFYAGQSLESLEATIASGGNGMPAFAETFDAEQQLALAAYVRSLAFGGAPASMMAGTPETAESTPAAGEAETAPSETESIPVLGSIEGQITNGTPGGEQPGALEVSIVGFDNDQPVFTRDVTADSEGHYAVDGVEVVSGRIFGAIVEYEGVPYYSSAGHLLEGEPELQLPITVFETTPDISSVRIDQMHVIFDFSVAGQVEVSQLWLVSNSSDRTVVQSNGQNAIPVDLPQGAANLSFGDQAGGALYTPTDTGFLMHEPVRPDDALELIFSFTLPYTRSLDYEQTMALSADSIDVITERNAPRISGPELTSMGERSMGEIQLQTYQRPGLAKGELLKLELSGQPGSASSGSFNTNLLIGLGALALALVIAGLGFWQLRMKHEPDPQRQAEVGSSRAGGPDHAMDRDRLVQAIAGLDAAFEEGSIDAAEYHERRDALKRELMNLMSEEHD